MVPYRAGLLLWGVCILLNIAGIWSTNTRRYTELQSAKKPACLPGYHGPHCNVSTGKAWKSDCVDVSRQEWGARKPTSTTKLGFPVRYFIHHSEGRQCFSKDKCSSIVKEIQNYHMDVHGWADIGYNFLIGEDGLVYEGRGWNTLGAHTYGWNQNSIGICVLGDFMKVVPSATAQQTLKKLMACGVSKGHIKAAYDLHGHRAGSCTSCPGDAFYNLLKTWPKFKGCLKGGCKC